MQHFKNGKLWRPFFGFQSTTNEEYQKGHEISVDAEVIYESETHNGVGELLEILGSIINGHADPIGAHSMAME